MDVTPHLAYQPLLTVYAVIIVKHVPTAMLGGHMTHIDTQCPSQKLNHQHLDNHYHALQNKPLGRQLK